MGSFFKPISSAISGWDLNLVTGPYVSREVQVREEYLDCAFVSNGNTPKSFKKHESNPETEDEVTWSVLNFINQVLLDDDLDNKSCTVENSTLEAAEKSFYDVISNDLNKKPNTICSCSRTNTNDLFDIVSDLQKYKSSICSCHIRSNNNEEFGSKVVKGKPKRLVSQRSFNSEMLEVMQGRNVKHMAVCPEDPDVLHEMFHRVLSLYGKKKETPELSKTMPTSPTRRGLSKRETIELRNLLTQCMKYLASSYDNNASNASKLLKQIRSRACVSGDGTERLAHYFADGLAARLDGGKVLPVPKNHVLERSGIDIWNAFKLYLTDFPFMETSYFFANHMIMTLAEKQETSTLHIIHFGIMQGLQWPSFIQGLSKRPGGPPKLRITGIDFPRESFLPEATVEGTKQRLASICKRFNVPFEYNGFVKNWETITLDDFKIEKDEVVVVNCLYQMMYLLDVTVVDHSPRDIVLRLIKRVNPALFVHVIVNGSYNSPFFMSRFRNALFHFSTLFDMFDVNLSRDNPMRMVFERDIWGRDIVNIIACEGEERTERPETYKQWQLRSIRAGFKQLPLNKDIVNQVRDRVTSCYHTDFFVDEAQEWLLDGWKGRALFALSCWEPASKSIRMW